MSFGYNLDWDFYKEVDLPYWNLVDQQNSGHIKFSSLNSDMLNSVYCEC